MGRVQKLQKRSYQQIYGPYFARKVQLESQETSVLYQVHLDFAHILYQYGEVDAQIFRLDGEV
jgi:hypothetical protein